MCNQTAKSFIKLGLDHDHTVAILGFNSPEWLFSMFGAIFAGYILLNRKIFDLKNILFQEHANWNLHNKYGRGLRTCN